MEEVTRSAGFQLLSYVTPQAAAERLDLVRDIAALKRLEHELRALPVAFNLRAPANAVLLSARGRLLLLLLLDGRHHRRAAP